MSWLLIIGLVLAFLYFAIIGFGWCAGLRYEVELHPVAEFLNLVFYGLASLAVILSGYYLASFTWWGLLAVLISPFVYLAIRGVGVLPALIVNDWSRKLYEKLGWTWSGKLSDDKPIFLPANNTVNETPGGLMLFGVAFLVGMLGWSVSFDVLPPPSPFASGHKYTLEDYLPYPLNLNLKLREERRKREERATLWRLLQEVREAEKRRTQPTERGKGQPSETGEPQRILDFRELLRQGKRETPEQRPRSAP